VQWNRYRPLFDGVRLDGARVSAVVRPLIGQTVETYADAAEKIRMALGASRVRVEPEGTNRVAVTLTIADDLADPFPAASPAAHPRLDRIVMGRGETVPRGSSR